MHNLSNIESKPMQFLSRVGDLIPLNQLWLLTTLPIITLGASTTALYSVLIHFESREVYDSGIFHRYFKAF